MTFDPDDPRLTAFVLGELDPSERPEFEAILESSPEARQAADEIRQTIGWLTDHLRDEQAAHTQAARPTTDPASVSPRRRWSRPIWIGLAASILIVGSTIALLMPVQYATPRAAVPEQSLAVSPKSAVPASAPGVGGTAVVLRSVRNSPAGPMVRWQGAGEAERNGPSRDDASQTRSTELALANGPTNMGRMMGGMGGGMGGMGGQKPGQLPAPQSRPAAQAGMMQRMSGYRMNPAQGQGQAIDSNSMYVRQARPAPHQANSEQAASPSEKTDTGVALRVPNEPPALSKSADTPSDRAHKQKEAIQALAAVEQIQPQGEVFLPIVDNPFIETKDDRQSTFSIDVDTAGYANVRRYLTAGSLPPPDAVRIEELLNYFPYDDAPPPADARDPFAVHVEIGGCPWSAGHRLARVGIQARQIDQSRRPPSNLVFLIDVSGSMDEELPMIQWGLSRLVEQLNENDRVAIVVYAGASGLVLPSKSCLHRAEILSTLESLRAGGSTNGGAGIQLAYQVAAQNFIKNGTNRVIWATDGDLNVGVTSQADLVNLIQAKAKSGVFLSVLGCGTGNIKDGPLEQIADKGNGHYAYIDSPREAYRVLVEQMGSTLVTVAKDVKIQVDFDPATVAKFRLIGYENRVMNHQDFADDTKDAGEIGAGHHVTALYEIVPTTAPPMERSPMTVKLRYKKPSEDVSLFLEFPVQDRGTDFGHASDDLKFASAVAGFGMMLRNSPYRGTLTYGGVLEIAQPTLVRDRSGYRKEFVELVRRAQALSGQTR